MAKNCKNSREPLRWPLRNKSRGDWLGPNVSSQLRLLGCSPPRRYVCPVSMGQLVRGFDGTPVPELEQESRELIKALWSKDTTRRLGL